VLDGLKELKICTGYRMDGQVLKRLPAGDEGPGQGRADLTR
jgi:adenylosuccinate synthase